jgi:hypothetical protein
MVRLYRIQNLYLQSRTGQVICKIEFCRNEHFQILFTRDLLNQKHISLNGTKLKF